MTVIVTMPWQIFTLNISKLAIENLEFSEDLQQPKKVFNNTATRELYNIRTSDSFCPYVKYQAIKIIIIS